MNKGHLFSFVLLACILIFEIGCSSNSHSENKNDADITDPVKEEKTEMIKEERPEWMFVAETDDDRILISTKLRIVTADNCIVFYKTLPKNLQKARNDKKILFQTKQWTNYEYTIYTEVYDLKLFRSKTLNENLYGGNEVILSRTFKASEWEYILPNTIGEDLCNKAKEIRAKYYYEEVEEYSYKEEDEDED